MIGLINWSNHKNLGDDVMAQILLDRIPNSVNMGEIPLLADFYILGGGTLISPRSLFLNVLPNPEKTIGISLGVSSNWNGEWLDIIKRIKKIYTRDYFSYLKLKEFGVENVLSVDLFCVLKPTTRNKKNEVWANLMYSKTSINPYLINIINNLKSILKDVKFFAMSSEEDLETIPEAKVYTNAQELLNDLTSAKTIFATRLHANILAWLSGCKDIRPIDYDPKINHFFERIEDLTSTKARNIINKHLNEVINIVA